MPVTIDSDTSSGHYQITLDKTENDKGSIRVKAWPVGVDPISKPPQKDDTNNLDHIKAARDGSKVKCTAEAPGPDPVVTCTVRSGSASSVEVDIRGTFLGIGDGTTTYPVTQADADRIKQFIVSASFPVLAG